MAEGVDQAEAAFRTVLNQGEATPPRDESGRFKATAPKPEPMFGLRAIEHEKEDGQPPADEERTDGRQEDDDESEKLQDGKGTGKTAPADGHGGTEEEQEVADGLPEHAEDEDPKWQVTLGGQPVEKFEVTVDGKPEQVSLGEALRGYIGQRTFHNRMQENAQARQVIEQEYQAAAQGRQALAERIQAYDHLLRRLTPEEPNWDERFAQNPAQARADQKTYQIVNQQLQAAAAEWQQNRAEAQAEYEKRSAAWAQSEFARFVTDAGIPDEPTLNKTLQFIRAYCRKKGFTEEQLLNMHDSRMYSIALEGALYDQARNTQPVRPASQPGRGRTLTPGNATPNIGNATRRLIDEAQRKLAKTGRIDDAAAVMARIINR